MRALPGWTLGLVVGCLCLSRTAWSKDAPRLAVTPLMVLGGMGNQDDRLEKIYLEELQRRGIQPWQPAEVHAFLSEQPDGNCHLKDECHARLAREVEASGTLVMTVAPYAREVALSARLVRPDGSVASETSQGKLYNPHPGTVPVELVRAEVRSALSQMKLEEGTAVGALGVSQSSKGAAVSSGPPAETWWAFGASAVSLAALGTVAIISVQDSKALQDRLDVFGRWGEADNRAIQLRSRLNTEGTLATVFISTAAVGAATGALFWLGLPQKWFGVSVGPTAGPGLSVAGRF